MNECGARKAPGSDIDGRKKQAGKQAKDVRRYLEAEHIAVERPGPKQCPGEASSKAGEARAAQRDWMRRSQVDKLRVGTRIVSNIEFEQASRGVSRDESCLVLRGGASSISIRHPVALLSAHCPRRHSYPPRSASSKAMRGRGTSDKAARGEGVA